MNAAFREHWKRPKYLGLRRMIHQHKADADNPKPNAKKRARRIFNATYYTVMLGLMGGPLLALWLGYRPPGWYFQFWILHMFVAHGVATIACRVAGVSQEGLKFEIIERDPRAALVPYLSNAPEFEIKELWLRQVIVDREGIEAKHADGKWKRVAWSEIETCTFKGTRNAVGNYMGTSFTLQGEHELPLLQIAPAAREADKLREAIRFYLRAESTHESSNELGL